LVRSTELRAHDSLEQKERDPARVAALYDESVKELASLKRSAIVNQLYGGWTLAVEKQNLQRERSEN
jgi:LYR motif-containing protein 4